MKHPSEVDDDPGLRDWDEWTDEEKVDFLIFDNTPAQLARRLLDAEDALDRIKKREAQESALRG